MATPLVINGVNVEAMAESNLPIDTSCITPTDRCVVLIKFGGGNDGLNTIIPLDQFEKYSTELRPNIHIPENQGLTLNQSSTSSQAREDILLHPALVDCQDIFNNQIHGLGLNIIQNVGYPNQNKSHFRSTDLMLRGLDGSSNYNSESPNGWVAKFLYNGYGDVVNNINTNASNPDFDLSSNTDDPLAIQLGKDTPSQSLYHNFTDITTDFSINLSGKNPLGLFSITSAFSGSLIGNTLSESDFHANIEHIQTIEGGLKFYDERISNVFNDGSNSVGSNYADTSLSQQLKTVAKLLNGGSKTKVFICHIGGFDTHVNQLDRHTALMTDVNQSIKSFYADLDNMIDDNNNKYSERVLTATFSEFGRKVKENSNFGCDHGTTFPMMVFGHGVKSDMNGGSVDLNDLTNDFQFNSRTYDYRNVFSSILKDWLGSDVDMIETTFGTPNNEDSFFDADLDIFKDSEKACTAVTGTQTQARQAQTETYESGNSIEISIYPNPNFGQFHIELDNLKHPVSEIKVINSLGHTLYHSKPEEDINESTFEVNISDYKGLAVVMIYNNRNQLVAANNIVIQ